MFPFSVESLNSLHVFLCEQRAVRAVGEVVVHTRGSGRSWRWSEPAPDCEPARVWLLHVQSWAGAGDRSGAGRPPLVVTRWMWPPYSGKKPWARVPAITVVPSHKPAHTGRVAAGLWNVRVILLCEDYGKRFNVNLGRMDVLTQYTYSQMSVRSQIVQLIITS